MTILLLLTVSLVSFSCGGGGGGGGGGENLAGMSLDGVTPSHGAITGGTACTIQGHSFSTSGVTVVTFGAAEATDVVVVDENTITCTAPAHAAGTVEIAVANSLGGSAHLPDGFTYHNAPSVTFVSPLTGPEQGGTAVTITGSDFTDLGATVVRFGAAEATGVAVVNATTITCNTPAGTAGSPVDVTVENDFGSGTLPGAFTYYRNVVLGSLDPDEGNVIGGESCTITGQNFSTTGETRILFDESEATNVVVVNSTTITCETPPHSAAAVDVTIFCDNGSDTLAGGYTYHNLDGIDPGIGPLSGGTSVTITGSDFTQTGTTIVTFDGVPATNIEVLNNTTISCETPAAAQAGAVDVFVANLYGYDTLPDAFVYMNAPGVMSVTPDNGVAAGGTAVTITGDDFTTTPDTTVAFGGVQAGNVVVVNATTITCTTPAHAAGAVDVEVANGNGTGLLPGGFVYHDPPDIQSVTPDNGTMAGGTAVTIAGTGFTAVGSTSVTFGGAAATDVVVVNATTITCTTPAHAPGAVAVVVTGDFGSDTLPGGYTYNNIPPPPAIGSLDPEHGVTGGGTSVTISGTGFTTSADTTVTFDGSQAGNVVVVSATTLTCTTPAHGAGAVDVTVTNSNGSDTLNNGFTYHGAPQISSVDPSDGPIAGGTAVTVTGSAFTTAGTTTVTFGGAQATQVVVVSATSITCTTPAHAAGSVDVVVANDFGSDTLSGGFSYHGAPTLSNLNCSSNGSTVDLTWTLTDPGQQIDEIVISRGSAELARTTGTAEAYQFTEAAVGYFRFTVEIVDGGLTVDSEDVLVHLGRVTWDLPVTPADGYYLYLAEAVGDPYLVLPYTAPQNFSYDVSAPGATALSLETLYNAGLIGSGITQGVEDYYLAASSYLVASPSNDISAMTSPLSFSFEVAIDTP